MKTDFRAYLRGLPKGRVLVTCVLTSLGLSGLIHLRMCGGPLWLVSAQAAD
jgi:hypothetical protein